MASVCGVCCCAWGQAEGFEGEVSHLRQKSFEQQSRIAELEREFHHCQQELRLQVGAPMSQCNWWPQFSLFCHGCAYKPHGVGWMEPSSQASHVYVLRMISLSKCTHPRAMFCPVLVSVLPSPLFFMSCIKYLGACLFTHVCIRIHIFVMCVCLPRWMPISSCNVK